MVKKLTITEDILKSVTSLPVKESKKKAKQKKLRPARTKKTKTGITKKIIEWERPGGALEHDSLGGRLDEL